MASNNESKTGYYNLRSFGWSVFSKDFALLLVSAGMLWLTYEGATATDEGQCSENVLTHAEKFGALSVALAAVMVTVLGWAVAGAAATNQAYYDPSDLDESALTRAPASPGPDMVAARREDESNMSRFMRYQVATATWAEVYIGHAAAAITLSPSNPGLKLAGATVLATLQNIMLQYTEVARYNRLQLAARGYPLPNQRNDMSACLKKVLHCVAAGMVFFSAATMVYSMYKGFEEIGALIYHGQLETTEHGITFPNKTLFKLAGGALGLLMFTGVLVLGAAYNYANFRRESGMEPGGEEVIPLTNNRQLDTVFGNMRGRRYLLANNAFKKYYAIPAYALGYALLGGIGFTKVTAGAFAQCFIVTPSGLPFDSQAQFWAKTGGLVVGLILGGYIGYNKATREATGVLLDQATLPDEQADKLKRLQQRLCCSSSQQAGPASADDGGQGSQFQKLHNIT